ncbi:SDR family NAD(P)-dependent oxidoreductase [Frateuria aurantia]
MSHQQYPLGTPFGPAATAGEVLAGIDLSGKNVIITAGHSGIGLEVTRALSRAGATVMIGVRNPEQAKVALEGMTGIEVWPLDLVDPESIRAFAAHWLASARPLHILINCAGIPAPAERVTDARGYEIQFAINHLGHFQLTLALLPALRAAHAARVVNVSSGAQRYGDIRWDDVNFSTGYDQHVAYAQSKLANVLFTVELDRRYGGEGVHAYAVHPGIVVGTRLNSAAGAEVLRAMGLIDAAGHPVIDPASGRKTPAQGASTIVFAAASPRLQGIGGVYLVDNDISALDDELKPFNPCHPATEVTSRSIDPLAAKRLWALSEQMLGS